MFMAFSVCRALARTAAFAMLAWKSDKTGRGFMA
jgi:hypothetical protein